jgi:hypothetical protein
MQCFSKLCSKCNLFKLDVLINNLPVTSLRSQYSLSGIHQTMFLVKYGSDVRLQKRDHIDSGIASHLISAYAFLNAR